MSMLYPDKAGQLEVASAKRHLRVQWPNGGRRAKNISTATMRALLSRFGDVQDMLLLADRGKAFVTYASVESATAAKVALHEQPQPDFNYLKMFVEYIDAEGAATALQAAAKAAVAAALASSSLLQAASSASTTGAGGQPGSLLEAAALLDSSHARASRPATASLTRLPGIPGLILIHDFLSEEEETALSVAIDAQDWTPQLSRRVQHYGHGFDYRTRTVPTAGAGAGAAAGCDPCTGGGGPTSSSSTVEGPPTKPLTGPVAAVAAILSEHGFLGDEGDRRLNDLILHDPLKGMEGLRRVLEALGPSLPSSLGQAGSGGAGGAGGAVSTGSSTAAPLDGLPAHTTTSTSASASAPHSYPSVDQVTINEYLPGRGISGHIDTHSGFQDGVVSVSVLDDIVMEFNWAVPGSPSGWTEEDRALRGATHHIVLPRRSLLLIRGEARYAWSHRIPARTTDLIEHQRKERARRVSATYRCVRRSPCRCAWPRACFDQEGGDSEPAELYSPRLQQERLKALGVVGGGQGGEEGGAAAPAAGAGGPAGQDAASAAQPPAPPPTTALSTPSLESTFVHAVYDAIAPHFSATRHSPWPRVEAYLRSLPVGSVVLDIGCGNGKYMGTVAPGRIAIAGCDRSEPLVAIAAGKGHEAGVGDAVLPPYRPACADVAMAIALLHHLSTRARRVAVIKGLLQAVRPGGQVLIYVWAQEQGAESKRVFGAQDILVPWCLQKRFFEGQGQGAAPAAGAGAAEGPHATASSSSAAAGSVAQSQPQADPLAALTSIGGTVDEARGAVVVQRYCHVYTQGEIEDLCAEAAADMGAAWVLAPAVQARAAAGKAADEEADAAAAAAGGEGGGKRGGKGKAGKAAAASPAASASAAPDATSLMVAGRPTDPAGTAAGPSAAPALIPDAAVEPARGSRGKKGASKEGAGAAAAASSPRELDAITARLVEHGARLSTRAPVPRTAGSAATPSASTLTVTALDLWWERDNWCILLQKD